MQYSAAELAEILEGKVVGNPEVKVMKPAKIEEADEHSISFYANPKYESYVYETNAAVLLVPDTFQPKKDIKASLIKVKDPYTCISRLLEMFTKDQVNGKSGREDHVVVKESAQLGEDIYLGAFTYIGENAKIGNDVKIFPHCFVGDNVTIADGTVLHSGVHVYHECRIGQNCIIHSGTVVGSDGFGFAPQENGEYRKILQSGNVILEDNVEIGANSVIDRATMGSTVIGKGVKIDNLVQIAHNVEIGQNTVIASQTGISGSTKIGRQVMIGGQAGFVGHIKIADGVKVNAQSGVGKSFETPGTSITGSPARGFIEHYRKEASFKLIPDLLKRIEELENQIKDLKE